MNEFLLSTQRANSCYQYIEDNREKIDVKSCESTVAAMPAFLRNNGLLHFVIYLIQNQENPAYEICLMVMKEQLVQRGLCPLQESEGNDKLLKYLLEGDISITTRMAIEAEITELLVWLKALLRAKVAVLKLKESGESPSSDTQQSGGKHGQ
ncbi:type III-B CRISPR module-associated protein Cmr5 [Vibrio gazogenes]|uniref:CRISPR type III-B/RAMP module-associated protein Cmr5 n=1 Tax=Vibrio gazogenes DSM 21264 = NBRC 103151 TaxID=1123492 RepID=A0A1M4VC94_VIBGA|nr:type III-B CRISPR module-associated protein Cmr5 [Vibrio gazogenes]USP15576.1 hypothetical protein MKS89_19485 [Vibrio gazogenes]SHE66562.1 CRISPR-associated protein (Cas_Cmr5) [Vibrio gazogenes DSM 21264] [Vibrio gazogenes DSM 21264 = NBRC 103151]SJN57106.1 CRISPR-associated protein (Cas_Cmr5) [Vibrio gazogenes]